MITPAPSAAESIRSSHSVFMLIPFASGAIRASFFVPIICFAAMFLYATVFGPMGKRKPVG